MNASRTGAAQGQGSNGNELHDILRQAIARRWSKEKLREALFNTDEQQPPRTPRPLIDFGDTPPDPAKTLLGRRFLCREGGMLFVGPSGIGKTSASVQQDLLWSIGQPAFGIVPTSPLRILTIQAEDDDGDLSEIVSGVKEGLGFTREQCDYSRQSCLYVAEKTRRGLEFLEKIVKPLLNRHRPDLLRINPFQAYLGGDIKDPAVTAAFLRAGLNPLLEQFQCGCILVHHTPKLAFRDTTEWKASDWMYAGAGAADITNWCRAALVIDPTTSPHIFRFIAAKRASRIGWIDDLTDQKESVRHFAHDDNERIYWREASVDEVKGSKETQRKPEDLMILVPIEGSIPKNLLLSRVSALKMIGQVKAKGFLAELIADRKLFEWRIPRPRTNPEVHIARSEQPVAFVA